MNRDELIEKIAELRKSLKPTLVRKKEQLKGMEIMLSSMFLKVSIIDDQDFAFTWAYIQRYYKDDVA